MNQLSFIDALEQHLRGDDLRNPALMRAVAEALERRATLLRQRADREEARQKEVARAR